MSFTTHTQDEQRQPAAVPTLLAACIAMALMPSTSFAATTTEETIVVDSASQADTSSDEEQDYNVKTTTAGTKMQMAQRDIPQSVSIISQQRMADQ
ncbi:ferric-rhodotorulic acid outer membrane transporter [Citrobacter koseri]|nr:ferric-rhodotorulic acid outer membrane transporter [Citrobacter koseri]STB49102.1 ferric-rhodotorulic acid outer membrane transporter [Citrobacter koseri]